MNFTDHYYRQDANITGVKDKETTDKESISSEDYIAKTKVEGVCYVLDACQLPPPAWKLRFYEQKSRKMFYPGGKDGRAIAAEGKKVTNALVKLVQEWIKEKMPETFYMQGSVNEEVYNEIADALKKSIKKYNVIDERDETKDDRIEGGIIKEGNPVGRIIWTTKPVDEGIELNFGDMDDGTKLGELENTYEEPQDIKTDKAHTTYKKSDKLEKN